MKTITQAIVFAAAFLAIGIAPTIEASDKRVAIVYNVASYHTDSRTYVDAGVTKKYNQVNTGFGLSYDFTKNITGAIGQYRNSENLISKYAAIDLHTSNKTFNIGVGVGAVTGYGFAKYTPAVLPNVTATFNDFMIRVGYVPVKLFDERSSSVLTFQVSYKIF